MMLRKRNRKVVLTVKKKKKWRRAITFKDPNGFGGKKALETFWFRFSICFTANLETFIAL